MVTEDVLRESVGQSVVALIHGVRDMAAIRQLKAAQTDSVSSEQVDNVRRMLLAMVDDFRCVVIKLAERVAHLREVRMRRKTSASRRQRVYEYLCAAGEPSGYRATEVGTGRLLLPLPASGGIQTHCKIAARTPH